MTPGPPRLGRGILERALPEDVREEVSGDLQELFDRRCRAGGALSARLWYWRQVFSFCRHFFAARLRDRREHTDMTTGVSWIDIKLAARMLVRYPGLTAVGVIGMAVAMAIATGAFTIVFGLLDPVVPLAEGERVVSIVNWDTSTNNRESRALRDLAAWRDELTQVQEVGAARNVVRNLIAPGAQPETVRVAEMTASGFAVARVQPLLGRYVLPEDERAGAPDVVVLGHDVWQRRFDASTSIVGEQVQLGDRRHTVIGVMPPGFGFPVNDSYWIPWHLDPRAYEPRTGPAIQVFGRLAPGATLESAQAEMGAIGQRAAAAFPQTHTHLQPRVKPYTFGYTDMDDAENYLAVHAIQTAIVLMLVVICVNVGILVYARTATRQGEIAVRTALGASRRRVVVQLFIEALALAGVAAVAGVGLIAVGLTVLDGAMLQLVGKLPFWIDFRLSGAGVLYVIGLTLLAGAIIGVVPALKATGPRVQSSLQGLSAGAGSRMQMGGLWTFLIVAQVAFAVALLPATIYHAWTSLKFRTGDPGYASAELLTTQLTLDGTGYDRTGPSGAEARSVVYGARGGELERRLEAEPAVSHVTYSLVQPGGELAAVMEAEGVGAPARPVDYNIVDGSRQGHFVRFNRVAPDFFAAMDVPLLLGRGFEAGDIGADEVIVNRILAERLFGVGNALGRRLRYVGRSREAPEEHVSFGRWYQIVGVVPDFPAYGTLEKDAASVVYHAANLAALYPATFSVRVRGADPASFTARLRELTAAVDPNLQLWDLSTREEVMKREQGLMRLIGITLVVVMGSVVLLSAAGVYALMSFTVARRRKEIGIRAALGADPSRILRSIFARALTQLGAGAVIGMLGAMGLEQLLEGEMFQGHGAVILPLTALFMTVAGLLAAIGPARRGLRIQPTEALRAE